MWFYISQLILRNRITILVVLAAITCFFGYFAATNVKMNTKFATMLPKEDPVRVDHEWLKEHFGEDGNVLVIGIEGVDLFQKDNLNAWYRMGKEIEKIEGIDSVFSVAHLYNLYADHDAKKFGVRPIMRGPVETQAEADSIGKIVKSLPFYRDLLFKDSLGTSLMMVTVDAEKFNSLDRGSMIVDIHAAAESYSEFFPQIRYSGLPFIRDTIAKKVKSELLMFVALMIVVMAIILYIFFRSIKVIFVCLLVVSVGVVLSLGTVGLLDYPVTAVMGLIPPLIIVIGVPNCIYLLNKYHAEYKSHGNKVKALSRVIQKVGNATFMTNMTTAMGFATFVFTNSVKLQHFGIVASTNIIAIFFVSLCIIPIIFSFLDPPESKHLKHLEKRWLKIFVGKLVAIVEGHRQWAYLVTVVVLGLSIYGVTLMITTGNVSGDLPQGDPIVEDLKHFEKEFGGVMPFEIIIDAKKEGGVTSKDNLEKIEKLQKMLTTIKLEGQHIFSKSLSVADAVKFANQALNFGDSSSYNLDVSGRDRINMKKYLQNSTSGGNVGSEFMDSTKQFTRVSLQVADIGSLEMDNLMGRIRPKIDSVLNPDRPKIDSFLVEYQTAKQPDSVLAGMYDAFPTIKYKVEERYIQGDVDKEMAFVDDPKLIYEYHGKAGFNDTLNAVIDQERLEYRITGTSVVFTKGTEYMVDNLMTSLAIAICIIAVIMAILFNSIRMVLISLLPNFIPLLFTAGVMGYFGIPIKPSTILVFSIAFGISVDDTIHYLAKYRQELKRRRWDIKGSVMTALKETGVSMIYTSIVLFFGFLMFAFSSFGGTIALGVLVSVTLLVAMLTNLVVLPSLLLSLEKSITTRSFKEPLLEIVDEEEDIDLENLTFKEANETNEKTTTE